MYLVPRHTYRLLLCVMCNWTWH